MTQKHSRISAKEMIAGLSRLRLEFTPSATAEKRRIIDALRSLTISNFKQLLEYHELLCFMQAYPDDARIGALADDELGRFGQRVKQFRHNHPKDSALDDTAMVNTAIHYSYSLHMARWLLRHFPDDVEIDWNAYNEKEGDPVAGMLPLLALHMENDGIDDEDLGTSDWVAKATAGRNTLRWLICELDRLQMPDDIRHYMYDNAELQLCWQLGESKCARTLAKLPDREIYYQQEAIRKHKIDLKKSVQEEAPNLKLVSREQGREIIETQIRALLPRHRELYPATFANPDEVYITTPGRGLEIYIIGMEPEHRMPLESNYGALLIKNGVPIGYGISVIFFDRCEIAINIFDSFRSGEASLIFEHFVKIFHHHFGAGNFIMRRWQVGYENEEGIQSGSYWFYYKLGFRSIDPQVDALARAEWRKIKRDGRRGPALTDKYRSDEKTLKKLATSDMHWSAEPGRGKHYKELSVIKLGYAVTDAVAAEFEGDRSRAFEAMLQHAQAALGITYRDWTPLEKLQLERFSAILFLIKDLERWNDSEKNAMVDIIKAKSAKTEKGYIGLLQAHHRFKEALGKIGF